MKGFSNAYGLLPICKKHEFDEKLKAILKVNTRTSLYNYRSGKTEPTLSEANAIAKLFSEYGITTVWE